MNNIVIFFIIVISIVIIGLIVWYLLRDNFENDNGNKIVLITEYFKHDNEIRQREINNSINKNINNKFINKVYLLNETDTKYPTNSEKIENIFINKRSTFEDSFKIANKFQKGTIVIISNNDISFDNTLNILQKINLHNTVICLGRRSYKNSNKLEYWTKKGLSQDSWIFKTPIKIPNNTNFNFGTSGCDHHIAYLLKSIGYNLINIPYDIKAEHNHSSNIRIWLKRPISFNNKMINVPITKLSLED